MFFFLYLFSLVYSQVTFECGAKVECLYDSTSKEFTVRGTGETSDFEDSWGEFPYDPVKFEVTSIVVEEGITYIGKNFFFKFEKATSVSLPKGLKRIGPYSFGNCRSLKEVTIPKTVTEIDEYAFTNTFSPEDGGNMLFEKGIELEILGKHVFQDSYLSHIEIPDSVKTVDDYCFSYCYSLEEVHLNKVENLGMNVFYGTSSKRVIIPQTLTNLAPETFEYSKNLESITVEEGNPKYLSIDGILHEIVDGKNVMICYPQSKYVEETDILIPEGTNVIGRKAFNKYELPATMLMSSTVEKIEEEAFFNCMGLKKINFGQNLKIIERRAFKDKCTLNEIIIGKSLTTIEKQAFESCKNIKKISVDENNEIFKIFDGILYSKDKRALLKCPSGIENLGTFTLPTETEMIYDNAFEGVNSLTELKIEGGNIKYINSGAFTNCKSLTKVTFDAEIKNIGSGLFSGCENLEEVYLGDGVKMIGSHMFAECTKLKTFRMSNSVITIERAAFKETLLTEIDIPDSTLYIRKSAFEGCTSLKKVTIGKGVTEILSSVFKGCTSLEEVTINSEELIRINDYAFSDTKITSIKYPYYIFIISDYAFSNTEELTTVQYYGEEQPVYCASNTFLETSVNKVEVFRRYKHEEFCGVEVSRTLDGDEPDEEPTQSSGEEEPTKSSDEEESNTSSDQKVDGGMGMSISIAIIFILMIIF